MRSIRRGMAWLGVGLACVLMAGTSAQAQAPGGASWTGYNPGYSWGMGTPGASVNPAAPPVLFVARDGSASWSGYVPYATWSGYAPGAAWQYVSPTAGTRPAYVANVVPGPRPRGVGMVDGRPATYREYGTGRPVALAKPWLPGSPGR